MFAIITALGALLLLGGLQLADRGSSIDPNGGATRSAAPTDAGVRIDPEGRT
jgi:hypothetical protein